MPACTAHSPGCDTLCRGRVPTAGSVWPQRVDGRCRVGAGSSPSPAMPGGRAGKMPSDGMARSACVPLTSLEHASCNCPTCAAHFFTCSQIYGCVCWLLNTRSLAPHESRNSKIHTFYPLPRKGCEFPVPTG